MAEAATSAVNGGSLSPSSNLQTPQSKRPSAVHSVTAPPVSSMNGHFAAVGEKPSAESFEHGIQVIDENKNFNTSLPAYFQQEDILRQGFNYHIISVFGSQSTGKSTLLNALFGTGFGVMSENERRQTTKGIWMSKNKRDVDEASQRRMAENILVMDVEGTDGRERGEDQDFERKSALFALATSEVLIVNIWEHQVGLYQGANMGLLKTVFEVNLGIFLKSGTVPRSLLFFVIRDHIGNTPLSNLRATLLADLSRIWSTLSKPPGLENSKIEDYFDFAFAALPHKILQPDAFTASVDKLGTRFREGQKKRSDMFLLDEQNEPILLPEYHRRIPADGFSHYANGIWEQIESNKDLDLPTQQELLAQFRCDEIAREVLVAFDDAVTPLETRQTEASKSGSLIVIAELGRTINQARKAVLEDFKVEASRYHQGVYKRKSAELESQVDGRLKLLFKGQLTAAHKEGVATFSDAVTTAIKTGQKTGSNYDFSSIVQNEKTTAIARFEQEAKRTIIEGAVWSEYQQELNLYRKDLDHVSAQLRKDELRRLATRVERWVRSHLSESVGLQFNKLGSGRAGSGAPETGTRGHVEQDLWDRIWTAFTKTVSEAEAKFIQRARSLDASPEEVEVGIWRLKRKSWVVLRAKIDEEVMEGNILLKLRENFEDKFRYDDDGVPRIWRPTDDIEGVYTKARESTLQLIPLLETFKLSETGSSPDLVAWIGTQPAAATAADEEDLAPIGGIDEDDGKTIEKEMEMISFNKAEDLTQRFRKTADGIYVEAKRSAIGGVTQVPLYFYGLMLALGWNEIVAILRNPIYFLFLAILGAAAVITYRLNLWGPIIQMTNAASAQGLDIFKQKLREFLESSDTGRQAMEMSGAKLESESYEMKNLNGSGKRTATSGSLDEDEEI